MTTSVETETVSGLNGVTLHRLANGVTPKAPFSQLRVEASRNLDDSERTQLFNLVDYRWMSVLRGGHDLEGFTADGQNAIIVEASSKNSFSSQPAVRMQEFADGINDFIATGSPIRKTQKNTRRFDGLENVTVTLWLDSVE